MNTKVEFNPDLFPPISLGVHEVLEACGYKLTRQEMMHVEYADSVDPEVMTTKKVVFSCLGQIQFSELDENRWVIPFACQIRNDGDEMDLLYILHHGKVIDLYGVPEMRTLISEALDRARARVISKNARIEPLTNSQLAKALVA